MENHTIQLVKQETFILSNETLRNLYTSLALCEYQYLRNPNYKEKILLQKLTRDFENFAIEIQNLTQKYPNNHTLNTLRSFFDRHYRKLLQLEQQKTPQPVN